MTLIFATTGAVAALINEKRPRYYAAEYLACETKAQRQAIADSVPEHLKSLVRLHIKISRDRKDIASGKYRN